MALRLSYMGTKRTLAPSVAGVIERLPEGPMLDVFAGMCAIGEAVAPSRPIWTNDTQGFAALVGKSLFASRDAPLSSSEVGDVLEVDFTKNVAALRKRFRPSLSMESRFLRSCDLGAAIAASEVPHVGDDPDLEKERRRLALKPNTFPYRLASLTYAGTYFGIGQAIEIDSIRFALDVAQRRRAISHDERAWLIVALCSVVSRINSSTGQFAEYIRPSARNLGRIAQKRRRSVWEEFLRSAEEVAPLGTPTWRSRNRVFQSDATTLLRRLARDRRKPTVIYADPPYSQAQYSRYYHALDVLTEYSYPRITGAGRYPERRFQSEFGLLGRVEHAMSTFLEAAAECAPTLVLSYPSNGLFVERGGKVLKLLRGFYRDVACVKRVRRRHSSFGGPKANPSVPVTENIYLAMR